MSSFSSPQAFCCCCILPILTHQNLPAQTRVCDITTRHEAALVGMKQNWGRHSLADKQFSALVNLLKAIERVCCWFWKGQVWWNNFERVESGETRTEAASCWCKRLWCTSLRLRAGANVSGAPPWGCFSDGGPGQHWNAFSEGDGWSHQNPALLLQNQASFIHPVRFSQFKLRPDMSQWRPIYDLREHQSREVYLLHCSLTIKRKLWEVCVYVGLLVYPRKQTKQIINRQILKFLAILWLLLLVEKNLSKGRSSLGPKKWTRQKIAPDSFYLPTILYWNYGCPLENRVKIKLR